MAEQPLAHARLTAFGSTRRRGVRAEDDAQLRLLLDAGTPTVALVAKSWDFHVRVVLRTSLDENLAMIADSVRYLKEQRARGRARRGALLRRLPGQPRVRARDAARGGGGGRGLARPLRHERRLASRRRSRTPSSACARSSSPAIGIHTHNDGELAVANALAAVGAGAAPGAGDDQRLRRAHRQREPLLASIPNLVLKLGLRVRRPDGTSTGSPSSRASSTRSRTCRRTGGSRTSAPTPSRTRAASTSTPSRPTRRPTSTSSPAAVGNERHILVSELSGRSNVLERARALGLELDGEARRPPSSRA